MTRGVLRVAAALWVAAAAAGAETITPTLQSAGVPVFATPAFEREGAAAAAALRAGDAAGAAARTEAMIALAPGAPAAHAMRALALARLGLAEAARDSLRSAAGLGFPVDAALLRDPVFAPLRGALPPPPPLPSREVAPAEVADGVARVGPGNAVWSAARGAIEVRFAFPDPGRRHPPVVPASDESREARLLARLHARGLAAGNLGDLYDNRDAGHSALAPGDFPQLAHVVYGPEAHAAGLDYGLNDWLIFGAPTLGNSSTALTSGLWRSLPRLAMTLPGGAARLHRLYAANHLYVFPENNDHDPRRGDLFPANTPYAVISQGQSGSDRPFLRAVAMALAALRPDVKADLRARGMIAPTVQMILRRSLKGVESDADYLSARAHPTVFAAGDLDVERMVRRASALTRATVPPVARISVVREDQPAPGTDLFGDGLGEALFDTPGAVARVARGAAHDRRYVLEAAADPAAPAARIVWRLLRGDPARVSLRPLDAQGRRAELAIAWGAAPATAPFRPDLANTRVDVAAFAQAGAEYSAPAFFSLAFPPCQTRRYAPGGALAEIDYRDAEGCYADPMIWPARDWRDVRDHDSDGRLLGWTRWRGAKGVGFTRDGHRVVTRDALGRPLRAERVAYPLTRGTSGRARVTETPTGRFVTYVYAGPADRLGVASDAPDGG